MANSRMAKLAFVGLSVLFVTFSIFWLVINLTGDTENKLFGATYGLIALFGGVYGLIAARNWGFFKSYIGKTICFLSLGLLLTEFGQLAFTYLSIRDEVIPYPSVADIGFFGAVIMYIVGAWFLFRGLGAGPLVRKHPLRAILGVVLVLALLALPYVLFFSEYEYSAGWLTVLLDFGYPLGQAIFGSIALVIFLMAGQSLGGVMRAPVLLLLFAFIIQYLADFNFLYGNAHETWVNGGYGDYLYLLAYFVMGAGLIYLNYALSKVLRRAP